jgi:glycosyltransferase involved in cell wall biosynthesis
VNLTVLMNAGPWLPVPPPGYGGIETVVTTLVPELRVLGVRVVLATIGPSTLPADGYVRPLAEPRFESIAAPYNQVSGIAHAHMHGVVRWLREHDVDLVHDHLEVVGPAILGSAGADVPPTLQTLHWDLRRHPDFYNVFDGGGRVRFAAVSQSQLERAPSNLRRQAVGVVPLAVPPPVSVPTERGEHVVVLARITMDKAQDVAARVARKAGRPLVLAGPVAGIDDPAELDRRLADGDTQLAAHPDVRFFQERVAPELDGQLVRWIGGVSGLEKERLLQSAAALLSPLRWDEPGATAVVEALTRGIPVVGSPRGVLPALVEHGVTGFLAAGESDLATYLSRVHEIAPHACRAAAAAWTPAAMAERYRHLYDVVLEGARSP